MRTNMACLAKRGASRTPMVIVRRAAIAMVLVGWQLLTVTEAAWAQPLIVVGDHQLMANTPGQNITVDVTGGQAVQGLTLNVQIGDGGPELEGVIDGPAITAVDILTGTIFETNNIGQDDLASYPQLAVRSTITAAGSVPASGRLATITIDTTGFDIGSVFDLKLSGTLNGDTDFAGVPATIVDGHVAITLVPEPSALVAVAALVAPVWLRRRSRSLR